MRKAALLTTIGSSTYRSAIASPSATMMAKSKARTAPRITTIETRLDLSWKRKSASRGIWVGSASTQDALCWVEALLDVQHLWGALYWFPHQTHTSCHRPAGWLHARGKASPDAPLVLAADVVAFENEPVGEAGEHFLHADEGKRCWESPEESAGCRRAACRTRQRIAPGSARALRRGARRLHPWHHARAERRRLLRWRGLRPRGWRWRRRARASGPSACGSRRGSGRPRPSRAGLR